MSHCSRDEASEGLFSDLHNSYRDDGKSKDADGSTATVKEKGKKPTAKKRLVKEERKG